MGGRLAGTGSMGWGSGNGRYAHRQAVQNGIYMAQHGRWVACCRL